MVSIASPRHASLPLSHFYREIDGSERLSQNLASNELFTPLAHDRITVSPTKFENYRANLEKKPRVPWGRGRDYGGLNKVQLPEEFSSPRNYPPDVVQKGHRHYGTGASDMRDLTLPQYYDITNIQKSAVRTNDQLLPPSPDKSVNERQIDLPFPAEHPYYSHTPRFAIFPKFNNPDDEHTGDPNRSLSPLHPNTAANAHRVIIANKTKGSPYRRELQEYPFEGDKEPLEWCGENDYYQRMKSPRSGRQPYYPTPPKMVQPNLRLRDESQRLELRSVNALRNVERDQWKTMYDYNYTGNGASNALHIDDYHRKMVTEVVEGRDTRNDGMITASTPTFVSPRPKEGRYARILQNRRLLTAPIRERDVIAVPDKPDMMDYRKYSSLPNNKPSHRISKSADATPCKKTMNDRSYERHLSQEEARYSHEHPVDSDDDNDEEVSQWKEMQLTSHPEHGMGKLVERRFSDPSPLSTGVYDSLPKTGEQQLPLAAQEREERMYLKHYKNETDHKFRNIRDSHEQRRLELQYLPEHDIHALRNKTDQMGNRLEPKAMDQHAYTGNYQCINSNNVMRPRPTCSLVDAERLNQLAGDYGGGKKDAFRSGLNFSTDNITDEGKMTELHDRQLSGYENAQDLYKLDIPIVTSPRRNHTGDVANYVTRTNPFSLSQDANRLLSRDPRVSLERSSSTGSILKSPGSPPRTGASRSISFNEVVRVATSEYGERFRVTSSPLSNPQDIAMGTRPFRIGGLRPSTPLPSQVRERPEPSIHPDISPRGPVLQSTSPFPTRSQSPVTPQKSWKWNYDTRHSAEFDRSGWSPRPKTPMPQTSLRELQDKWSKADAHKRFHENFPETAPDFRDNVRQYEFADKSADLRFTRSAQHKEKRHNFYGFNSYHFYNGNAII